MKRCLIAACLILLAPAFFSFASCKKVIICKCSPEPEPTKPATFSETAAKKLDSLRTGKLVGKYVKEYHGFNNHLFENKKDRSGGSGGVDAKQFDLGGGWNVLRFNTTASGEAEIYMIYKDGETVKVTSSTCGVLDFRKFYMYITTTSLPYADEHGSMSKPISNQTLILDETHPLPMDNSLLCSNYSKFSVAASNETWEILFIFYN